MKSCLCGYRVKTQGLRGGCIILDQPKFYALFRVANRFRVERWGWSWALNPKPYKSLYIYKNTNTHLYVPKCPHIIPYIPKKHTSIIPRRSKLIIRPMINEPPPLHCGYNRGLLGVVVGLLISRPLKSL